ncbi:MAG: hypothetical protein GKR77_06310 [Legionellales bacterium]|nr:hypothetical protein [Legionellales bacterium]
MLRQLTLIRFPVEVERQQINAIFNAFNQLKKHTMGVMNLTYGDVLSTVDNGYTHVVTLDFADQEYLREFTRHAKYLELCQRLTHLLEDVTHLQQTVYQIR